jgi:hypothetical protein
MKADDREFNESPLYQGEDERIAHSVTTTPWGSSPSGVSVVLKDSDGTDVSATHLTGSSSISGDVITLPTMHSLTADERYRLEVKFTVAGNEVEAWGWVYAQE